jgi:hypothetical protein
MMKSIWSGDAAQPNKPERNATHDTIHDLRSLGSRTSMAMACFSATFEHELSSLRAARR